jgi:polysaccharide deacetylase family protein (PEP-CTERM system associated)
MEPSPPITNYLTVDVEDYFQVSAFEGIIDRHRWEEFPCRVERNTHLLLRLFAEHGVGATFFVTGWIAERYPQLVEDIARQGHEIACHSYWHRKVYDLTPDEFRRDTQRAKDALETVVGRPITGYRAPSYSITARSFWALDILAELGFTYDSSIFPVHHDTYGVPDAPRFPYLLQEQGIMEYPPSTLSLAGLRLPIAGGGYFRLFPYRFSAWALGSVNSREGQPFVFYLHPWEVDPDQPRVSGAGWKSRFRHYNNLAQTSARLERLLQRFRFAPIPLCAENPAEQSVGGSAWRN